MGLIGFVLGTLIVDLPVVIMQTAHFARAPRRWLQLISEHRGTITFAPNFAYQLVGKRVKERDLEELDLSSLRIAGCGAEPIRARTLSDFAETFAPAGFDSRALLPSYGMAESCLAVTFHPRGTEMSVDRVDPAAMRDGLAKPAAEDDAEALEVVSCGVPFPGHAVEVRGEDGSTLGERAVGEIVIQGPSVTTGYFQNPEATASAIRDGWLHTGDLGYWAGGNLHICGRIKDLIIINGANHYPQDLEWAVGELPGVRRGNVCAFSVVRDGTEQLVMMAEANRGDAERLRKEIAQVTFQEFGLQVTDVVISPVGTLPKTSSGKHQRRKTQQLYERGELAAHP